MRSSPYIKIDPDSAFPLENLPYGIFSTKDNPNPRVCTRVGNFIFDISELSKDSSTFSKLSYSKCSDRIFNNTTLNDFIELGKDAWKELRSFLQNILSGDHSYAKDHVQALIHRCTILINDSAGIKMHLPLHIGDYTDFFASKEHATNTGTIFRGPENALNPNWVHLPIAYHGRASSIVVSGTPIMRPQGQLKPKDGAPYFGPTEKLDFELEMAFIIGKENKLGTSICVNSALDHVFGMVLMNDWSARDIQSWEYVPLGPFLGKNFATTISPWVITMEALEPFLTDRPLQTPKPLPYLDEKNSCSNYDIHLEVSLQLANTHASSHLISTSNLKYMYWSIKQQLAQHTVNGCNMRIGDICGTGTLSGPDPSSYGSLLELSWNGTKEISFSNTKETRFFLKDYDTVIMTGICKGKDYNVGFGECRGQILPACQRYSDEL